MAKIEIYTQIFCPYCARAIALLRKKGVAYHEINAPNGSEARREALKRSGGGSTVPQIFIDDKPIGGYDDLYALEQRGALDPLITA
jgi:glutaredoxin 3